MTLFVMLRGPSAVGKTRISKELLLSIKKNGYSCGYISEDNFRKQMQFKYKANDEKVHFYSVKLIKAVINELLSLDNYDVIILEGLFRYEKMVDEYESYFSERGCKFFSVHLSTTREVREERDQNSDRDHYVGLKDSPKESYNEEAPYKNSLLIDTSNPLEDSLKKIYSEIEYRL